LYIFRPVYIQEFASQCFAFVARKVRDKDGLVKAMLEKIALEEDVIFLQSTKYIFKYCNFQGIEGTGILISETLYGVSGCFHSTAEQFLTLLLSYLSRPDVNPQILQQVLSGAFRRLVFKVKIDNFAPFWNASTVRNELTLIRITQIIFLQAKLEKLVAESEFQALARLLSVLQVVCETKGGSYFQSTPILSTLKNLTGAVPEETYGAVASLVAKMLCAPALKMTQEHNAALTSQVKYLIQNF